MPKGLEMIVLRVAMGYQMGGKSNNWVLVRYSDVKIGGRSERLA